VRHSSASRREWNWIRLLRSEKWLGLECDEDGFDVLTLLPIYAQVLSQITLTAYLGIDS
jgi:hypothetical protein